MQPVAGERPFVPGAVQVVRLGAGDRDVDSPDGVDQGGERLEIDADVVVDLDPVVVLQRVDDQRDPAQGAGGV